MTFVLGVVVLKSYGERPMRERQHEGRREGKGTLVIVRWVRVG